MDEKRNIDHAASDAHSAETDFRSLLDKAVKKRQQASFNSETKLQQELNKPDLRMAPHLVPHTGESTAPPLPPKAASIQNSAQLRAILADQLDGKETGYLPFSTRKPPAWVRERLVSFRQVSIVRRTIETVQRVDPDKHLPYFVLLFFITVALHINSMFKPTNTNALQQANDQLHSNVAAKMKLHFSAEDLSTSANYPKQTPTAAPLVDAPMEREQALLQRLKEQLTNAPSSAALRLEYARQLYRMDRCAEAAAEYEQLAASGKLSYEDQLEWARCLVAAGHLNRTLQIYRAMLRTFPGADQQLQISEAAVAACIASGNRAEAVSWCRHTLSAISNPHLIKHFQRLEQMAMHADMVAYDHPMKRAAVKPDTSLKEGG